MEPLWGSVAFKATAFNHSAISPPPVGVPMPCVVCVCQGQGLNLWPRDFQSRALTN